MGLNYLIYAIVCLCSIGAAQAERVTVFAAASLRDVLEAAVQEAGQDVIISYGGSGTLARQIAQGAQADMLILANTRWMDWLQTEGIVTETGIRYLASNRLVLAGPKEMQPFANLNVDSIMEKLNGGRLAVGQVEMVPAGFYARDWMQHAGLWETLSDHLAQTDNVRTALALVARGEVPLAVVYASDLYATPKLHSVYSIPQDTHEPIIYPMAVLTDQAVPFADFLSGSEGISVFRKFGFLPAPRGQ